jgi:hypothetical protein
MDDREYTTAHETIVMKSAPKHRADTVSYMLKGQICTILADDESASMDSYFVRIKLRQAWYEGYVLRWQLKLWEPWAAQGPEIAYAGLDKKTIMQAVEPYLWAPYLRWGKMPYGIDCSWLTQVIYEKCGIKIGRDVSEQITQGREVDFEDAKIWDLMFFMDKQKDKHVWVLIDVWGVLHASQSGSADVRIDKFDDTGIIDSEWRWSHFFHSARRYV